MTLHPLTVIVIILICAAVFGGIVFFGSRGTAVPTPTPSPITRGTAFRTPDILNLPGFGNRPANQNANRTPSAPIPQGTGGPDVVVENSKLPSPAIPPAPAATKPIPKTLPPSRNVPPPSPVPAPQPQPIPQPAPAPVRLPQPAAASFSVFDASLQLGDFRTQMVQEGVIKDSEFVRIRSNADMEAFMLKLVEWQARKAGSTDAQIQDARDRVIKAYARIRPARK